MSRLVAEGAVIVVSILFAFAVDAWWDSRQDREREAAYLRQLVTELEGTLFNNAHFDGRAAPSDAAAARLVQSYYEATPPSQDSVRYWINSLDYWVVQPRLGTVETLVGTGDLALIRDDSLRVSIPDYLTTMMAFDEFEAQGERLYLQAVEDLGQHLDRNQLRMEMLSRAERADSLRADPLEPLAAGPMRDLQPQDLAAIIRDPEAHRALTRLLDAKRFMRQYRGLMRLETEDLLRMVRVAQTS